MTDFRSLLESHVRDRGAAAMAVVAKAGDAPVTSWTPAASEEPGFLAYSITKTFTAALILKLAEENRLGVDDRLSKWIASSPHAREISLRQLLNHTSGIPDYGPLSIYHDEIKQSPSTPWPFERFLAETMGKGLSFKPGEGWSYSNPGYMLLKRVAELATGSSYRSLIVKHFSRPLGLKRTFVAESIVDLAGLAAAPSRYLSADGAKRDTRSVYHPGWVSHGVIASTASEIAVFLDALFGGRLLSRESIAQMLQLVAIGPRERFCYGLGLMADPDAPGGLMVGHNGSGPGYSASAHHSIRRGATVCVMAAIEEGFDAEVVARNAFEELPL